MTTSKFEFDGLVKLLGRSENDSEVQNFFWPLMSNIERNEYYGFLEFKHEGVSVVFQEAPWVLASENITDPRELYLVAFHLHREGHEGYAGYSCQLPNNVLLGDSKVEVLRKMGEPNERGGGNMIPVLKRPAPLWLRYALDNVSLRFQLDSNGQVEVVTPSKPRVQGSAATDFSQTLF